VVIKMISEDIPWKKNEQKKGDRWFLQDADGSSD